MLAQIHPGGVLEILDAEAWVRALGYTHEELGARSLRELMGVDDAAAREVVAGLLDENADRPLDVTLRCKGGARKVFTLYRRFDAYAAAMFVLADEQGFATEQTGPAPAPTMADGHGRGERSARPQLGPARQPLRQL